MAKTSGNPTTPRLSARVKNAQGLGGGIRQGKGGAKFVSSARPGTGLRQTGTTAKKPAATRVGVNKLNKKPISAQPKSPKNVAPAKQLRNSVTKGDVSRLRKAGNLATPSKVGGGFKSFLGGK